MKIIVSIIFLLSVFCGPQLSAQEEPPTIGALTLHFYNPEDFPPALPFMSITLTDVPRDKYKELSEDFPNKLNKALREKGGVRNKADYEALVDIIPGFVVQLTESGVSSIRITFPRIRQSMLIHHNKTNKKMI